MGKIKAKMQKYGNGSYVTKIKVNVFGTLLQELLFNYLINCNVACHICGDDLFAFNDNGEGDTASICKEDGDVLYHDECQILCKKCGGVQTVHLNDTGDAIFNKSKIPYEFEFQEWYINLHESVVSEAILKTFSKNDALIFFRNTIMQVPGAKDDDGLNKDGIITVFQDFNHVELVYKPCQ